MDAATLRERLADIHRGRRFVIASEVSAAAAPLAHSLREWGAAGVMVVSAATGVGDQPEDVDVHFVGRRSGLSILGGIRDFSARLEQPSPDLVAALDRFDPEGEALVLLPPFTRVESVAGRKPYGARTAQWEALEDKTTVDALWDGAGVERTPSEVVPLDRAPQAARRLAGPLGTVWTADNSRGWHGGGEAVRWVPDAAAIPQALSFFSGQAERVRVMPFLDGLPCSIHGFVTARGAAVFRPVEIMILRSTHPKGFVYAGVSTFWDPPPHARDEMRHVARRVAAELDRRCSYRGAFGIDGVGTRDGFRPTELNARLSAGLNTIFAAVADLPLEQVQRAVVARDLDIDPGWLEETATAAADARRGGGMGLPVPDEIEPGEVAVRFLDGRAEEAGEGPADAALQVGPSPSGSYIRMKLDPERIPAGPSVAPYAAAAIPFVAERWRIELPPVEPAPDLLR